MIDPTIFKHEFSSQTSSVTYGITIFLLLVIMVILAKKNRPYSMNKSDCKLIEKKHLSHKTVVYVIEYQQQRFMLADNQQALAIHPLKPGDGDEQ